MKRPQTKFHADTISHGDAIAVLTGSHAMRRIYLTTIGGMPRSDWCLLSNRVSGTI